MTLLRELDPHDIPLDSRDHRELLAAESSLKWALSAAVAKCLADANRNCPQLFRRKFTDAVAMIEACLCDAVDDELDQVALSEARGEVVW